METGVMKVNECESAITYRVACDCLDNEHDGTLDIEYDKDLNMIFLNFYKKLCWSTYWSQGWWGNFKKRIFGSFTMLFRGWIEVEEAHVFQDVEHIENFIKAMQEGLDKVKVKRDAL